MTERLEDYPDDDDSGVRKQVVNAKGECLHAFLKCIDSRQGEGYRRRRRFKCIHCEARLTSIEILLEGVDNRFQNPLGALRMQLGLGKELMFQLLALYETMKNHPDFRRIDWKGGKDD